MDHSYRDITSAQLAKRCSPLLVVIDHHCSTVSSYLKHTAMSLKKDLRAIWAHSSLEVSDMEIFFSPRDSSNCECQILVMSSLAQTGSIDDDCGMRISGFECNLSEDIAMLSPPYEGQDHISG